MQYYVIWICSSSCRGKLDLICISVFKYLKCPPSQVFLKYYHVEHLNLMVQQSTQRIILLQAYVRGWLGAKRYRQMLKEREQSALVLQSGL